MPATKKKKFKAKRLTADQERDLKKMNDAMAIREAVAQKAQQYGRMAARHLKSLVPGDPGKPLDFETSPASDALAEILNQFVHRDWDSGGYLCIEWAMERFWGLQFQEQYMMFVELHNELERRCHQCRHNALVWNDLDWSAWIEPVKKDKDGNKTRLAFVLDSQGRSILFVIDRHTIGELYKKTQIHVRNLANRTRHLPGCEKRYIELPSLVWYRNRRFEMKYGDCRDNGYILSYTKQLGTVSIDRAYDHLSDIAHVVWFAQMTLAELIGGSK